METGILEPMGLKESEWCSQTFPVMKSDGCNVCIVTDFKVLKRCVKRPNQLLRQIKSTSRFFCTIDMVSGYHQCAVDDASSDLVVIENNSGRYRLKVLAQGVSSASDVFNIVTDRSTTYIYLLIYLIIYKIHLNAPRVVKVHHEEHQVNEPLARLL